jgi:hypothetical protein
VLNLTSRNLSRYLLLHGIFVLLVFSIIPPALTIEQETICARAELVTFFAEYEPKNIAFDLGCGQGRDSIALARAGSAHAPLYLINRM